MKNKKAIKGQVLPSLPELDAKTKAKAMNEHEKIVEELKSAKASFVKVAGRLAKMQESELWRGVTTSDHKNGFNDWDSYRMHVLGSMGKTKFYELLAVHQLTQGANPLAASTIEQMGSKCCYEISRLKPEQRTPEVITLAQTGTVTEVKQKVQEILNKDVPKDQQKEHTVAFVRMMPPSLIAKYEALEEVGVWMKGICDHDPVLTAKQKLFYAMITNFEANHQEELHEAELRKLQHQESAEPIHETTWAEDRAIPAVAGV